MFNYFFSFFSAEYNSSWTKVFFNEIKKRMLEEAQSLKLKKPSNSLSNEEEATLKTYLDQRIIDLEKYQQKKLK